jgi:hypothetical protein
LPRSGNTFATALLLAHRVPAEHIAHHSHRPAALRLSLAKNIIPFVLLRDPLRVLVSWLIREKGISPNCAVQRALKYYTYLERNDARLKFIGFNDLVQNPCHFIETITRSRVREGPGRMEELALELVRRRSQEVNEGSHIFRGGFPSSERDCEKENHERYLKENFEKEIDELEVLHSVLREKKIQLRRLK